MIAAAYGSVEDIEIFWVLIAVVGLLFSGWNIREALGDYRFVEDRRIGNGRRVLARTHLISETLRFIILSIFLTIGILSMTIESPPSTHSPHNVIVIQAVLRWGLLVSSFLLVVKTYLAKRARDQIKIGGATRLTDEGTNPKESVS